MKSRRLWSAAVRRVVVLTWVTTSALAENWPQFRGPTGMGISTEMGLPIEWGGKERKNVRWSTALPGEGHASPIVWGDRVIVCTVPWDDDPGHRAAIPAHHVTAYSTADGKQLWDTQVPPGKWLRNDFRSGPGGGYAAPTPCTDGKYVFAAFGSSVLAALDAGDGRVVWRNEIEPHTFDVTVGGSPVLYGDSVIFLCAMAKKEDSRLIAFNKADGAVKWETKLPTTGFGHSTPVIIEAGGRPQILMLASAMGVTPDGLQSFDPATGKRLWWCRGGGDASSPAFGDGVVYFDSGRGGPGFAVDPTGSGDVTKTHVKWTIPRVTEGLGSPTIAGGYVYRLQSPNVLRCWKSPTGEQVYQNRLDGITTTWASPITDADGHLFFANGGKSFVVKAGPAFEVLAVNDLNDANHASAAAADGRLYIVGKKQVYCIGTR